MTRRERLERKAEKREQWAESREASSARNFDRADLSEAATGIPLGQPILVGHHSERRHRRVIERADAARSRAVEDSKMASHHASRADGLRRALDNSIFSDDPDAVEALTAKVEHLEAKREVWKAINKAWKKAGSPAWNADDGVWRAIAADVGLTLDDLAPARSNARHSWDKKPYPAYSLTNLSGNISRCRKRIDDVKARQAQEAKVEAAGGFLIERRGDYCTVAFADFPGRGIVNELKAANFHWSGGRWFGHSAKLPASVLAMEAQP